MSQYEFLYQNSFSRDPIVIHRFQVKFYGFPDIDQSFFFDVSLAYAARWGGDVNCVPAFFAGLQNSLSFSYSLLTRLCSFYLPYPYNSYNYMIVTEAVSR